MTRATAFEKALGTPAKIYYKNEGMSPPGSHKPNTAVPQAYYNKVFGIERSPPKPGPVNGAARSLCLLPSWAELQGVHGADQLRPETLPQGHDGNLGGQVHRQPSNETKAGRTPWKRSEHAGKPGHRHQSEAVEAAVSDTSGKTRYSLGSVLNHVMLHQTIIGLEAKKQFEMIGDYPDIVIGCAGGGSNFAGLAFPFVLDKINGKQIEIYPVEPKACPTMTRAPLPTTTATRPGTRRCCPCTAWGTTSCRHPFTPAVALPRHGAHRQPADQRRPAHPKSVGQMAAYEAGVSCGPAPKASFPRRKPPTPWPRWWQKPSQAKEEGKEKTIVVNFSGHGLLDLGAYDKYFAGELFDYSLDDAEIEKSTEVLKNYPKPQDIKSV
jgi:tryptophan synthase beta chain